MKDNLIGAAVISYIAVACVVFGFFVKTNVAAAGAAIFFGLFVAGIWPVSALIWFGVWLA